MASQTYTSLKTRIQNIVIVYWNIFFKELLCEILIHRTSVCNGMCGHAFSWLYRNKLDFHSNCTFSLQTKWAAFEGNFKTKIMEPRNVPLSLKVNQHNKPSLAQLSLTYKNDGVLNIKPLKTKTYFLLSNTLIINWYLWRIHSLL